MKRGKPLKRTGFKRRPAKKKRAKSDLQKKKDNPHSKYWRDRADRAWARWAHGRGRGCEICGTTDNLNAHHLIKRGNIHLRHNPFNSMILCVFHHTFSPKLSAHGAELAFAAWLQEKRPGVWAWVLDANEKNQQNIGGPKPDYREAFHKLERLSDTFYGDGTDNTPTGYVTPDDWDNEESPESA